MAIKCARCDREISETATVCPGCRRSIESQAEKEEMESSFNLFLLLWFVVSVILTGVSKVVFRAAPWVVFIFILSLCMGLGIIGFGLARALKQRKFVLDDLSFVGIGCAVALGSYWMIISRIWPH